MTTPIPYSDAGHDATVWRVAPASQYKWNQKRLFLAESIYKEFDELCVSLQIQKPLHEMLWKIYIPVSLWILGIHEEWVDKYRTPLVVGVTAPPGVGKTTLSLVVQLILEIGCKKSVAVVQLDSLYKTQSSRKRMASRLHPLFETRGVPGTHDLGLAFSIFRQLFSAAGDQETMLPVFDKARDDRVPKESWIKFRGRPDIVLFEGWCVGAKPQSLEELRHPVNSLEEDRDVTMTWRKLSNKYLGKYQRLFSVIGSQILINPPSWPIAVEHRWEQEAKRDLGLERSHFDYFLMFYQRLTEAIAREMPGRCDVLIETNSTRDVTNVTLNRVNRMWGVHA